MTGVTTLRVEPAARLAPNPGATLDLILLLVRQRARRLARLMERAWEAGRSSPDQGLAITAGEVAWLLAGEEGLAGDVAFAAADPAMVALHQSAARTGAALARDPAWAGLRAAFALDDDEADFLALLVAVEADPGLQRVIAYLHDDSRLVLPTPALSIRLAGRHTRTWPARNILRWRLAAPVDGAPPHALTSAWRIDPAVLFALTDGEWRDPEIDGAVELVGSEAVASALALQPAALALLQRANDLTHVELTGPIGIGRQTLAASFAASRRQPLLVANTNSLIARHLTPFDAVTRVLRHARSNGALVYFRDAEAVPAADWARARELGVEFLRGTRIATASETAIALAPLTLDQRQALWGSLDDGPSPAVIASHRLVPAEIARLARAGSGPAAPARSVTRPDHNLLARLACPYDWDDLVLPPDVSRQLREFADQVRLRWSVYDEWGFGRLAHLGTGIAALFGGPSGTGKTMAAQVIARSLGLELYRVDLAGVVNKYVGETEKKLREVFDACEDSGALLFFDEADALFGGRMQVKDAHDRFANIETNYLLQRIETYDGIAILATNRRDEIDEAFVRRLRFIVDFLPPRPEDRLILWRRALRETSPSGEALLEAIDWALLAERLNMTGAAIKNTALSAAFLARAEGRRIGMDHILHAARRELGKNHDKLPVSLREGDGR
ncbi:ATP-binding protein [Novosphingobium lentum]|uniref:ATP-binding protein n=1 Tax=Novosphingobium lentum TaxID=145287 RepID=UPI000831E3D5|nr:ATP-binding protein [Novosphingobium lentum]